MTTQTTNQQQNLFLNLTQHQLTPEQISLIKQNYTNTEIKNLKDINPELFQELKNTPPDYSSLDYLADKLLNYIYDIYFSSQYNTIYIHLPIGSPAFMWQFSKLFERNTPIGFKEKVIPVFSHSERQVEELVLPDGTVEKKSIFKFQSFIEM